MWNNIEHYWDLAKGMMWEYEGTVTQLGAGSEVANIGIRFTGRSGERYLIVRAAIVADTLAAGKNHKITLYNSSGWGVEQQVAALNNQVMHMSPYQSVAASNYGFLQPILLGGNQFIDFHCDDTLDAAKTLKVRMHYISLHRDMAVSAIGTGITISNEVHKQV